MREARVGESMSTAAPTSPAIDVIQCLHACYASGDRAPTRQGILARDVIRMIPGRHERSIRDVVVRMGTLLDARSWDALAELFTDPVRADWSKLSGAPAAAVHPADLVAGWRQALSGLDATHHLIANHEIELDAGANVATARAYVHTAYHLAAIKHGDPVWIIAGRYEHRLVRSATGWQIAEATFHPTWLSGNEKVMTIAGGWEV